MRSAQIYAERIEGIFGAFKPRAHWGKFLALLGDEGLDTASPILYGYDSVRCLFWFRNDAVRGELIRLPLQKVKVWPEGPPPKETVGPEG
jgi:hypothetical protein